MFPSEINNPRWYVLAYLGTHRDALRRLSLVDLPCYAPEFFARLSDNDSRQDYLEFVNYAFVRGSQNEIYELKRNVLRHFNFLPMEKNSRLHPYVEDYVIEQLRKVEKANDGMIPFTTYQSDVVNGDTIRILGGDFKGYQATAITKSGSKYREVVLDIAGKFLIPLCKLKAGEYEIVGYSKKESKTSASLAFREDTTFLHEALKRHHGVVAADEVRLSEDASKATAIAIRYRAQSPTTHPQRIKHSTLMVMAYTIIGNVDEQRHYIEHTINLLAGECSLPVRLDAYCTIYGCTFDDEYYRLYHEAKKETRMEKESKAVSNTSKLMDTYIQWRSQVLSSSMIGAQNCPVTESGWFAVCISVGDERTVALFTRNGMEIVDPLVDPVDDKKVLLVNATFGKLKELHSLYHGFTFVREEVNGQEQPLHFSDSEIGDYRHIMASRPEDIQHMGLTADYEKALSKAKQITIDIDGREVSGVMCCRRADDRSETRFVYYLRHLCAISVPHTST